MNVMMRLGVMVLIAAGVVRGAVSWDILNLQFGNGAGEVSFNSQVVYPAGWGGAAPAEVRSAGFTTLTVPLGDGAVYPAMGAIDGMPAGDGAVTVEFKVRSRNKTPVIFYMSQSNDRNSSRWNHIFEINQVFETNVADSLADYNRRERAVNLTMDGFDGASAHVYRLVHEPGTGTRVYVDDSPVAMATLEGGSGAAGDGYQLMWGFIRDAAVAAQIDVYYLRIGNGAWPPRVVCNILDQSYGGGAGEVAFNEQYSYPAGWGGTVPAEMRSNGFSTLTIPAGNGFIYPAIRTIVGMPGRDVPVTIEYKIQNRNNRAVNLFISQTNTPANSAWNHLLQLNKVYDTDMPDGLADYNLRSAAVNAAPAGFDGSVVHVYRLEYDPQGGTRVFVDDQPVAVMTLQEGVGAAGDGYNLIWGFAQDPDAEVKIDVYYLRIRGEYPPVGRGHRILIERGLQIQALAYPNGDGSCISPERFAESHFTGVNSWTNPFYTVWPNSAPRPQWGRLLHFQSELDPQEALSAGGLVTLQFRDEHKPYDTAFQAEFKAWADRMRQVYPDTILHTNFEEAEVGEPDGCTLEQLQAFQLAAQPDMLTMTCYPFRYQGAGFIRDYVGDSPTGMYQNIALFRRASLLGNDGTGRYPIPYGIFLQTMQQTADTTNGRDPSESEMRFQQFSAWAFGFKWTCAFVYNLSNPGPAEIWHTSLFTDLQSDANPTSLFYSEAETNRQSRNLSPALVRLLSTEVRFIPGEHVEKVLGVPVRMVTNTIPVGVTGGIAGADPYITGISAVNSGSKNDGKRGDVVVGVFRAIDESFDGPNYSNQVYFMVLNGLADGTGTVAETRQRIRIDFDFGASGITSLHRLSRLTGGGEVVTLMSDGGSRYHLDLELDGGTGDLFKYNTGAPFVGIGEIDVSLPGDANRDGRVDVSDLGILAANYGLTGGATWEKGDFNADGKVDVSDLGILAANYGQPTAASSRSAGTGSSMDFNADAGALGLSLEDTSKDEEVKPEVTYGCGAMSLPLILGVFMAGLVPGRRHKPS